MTAALAPTGANPVVAILAGGLATRLGPIAATVPKSMLVVGGEPFVAHQLRRLEAQGLVDVVICAGHFAEQIVAFVRAGDAFRCRVRYSFDGEERLGTGGALRKAAPILGAHFMAMYGDSYLTQPFRPIWEAFLQSGKAALMAVFRNEGLWDKSNIEFRDGRIVRYAKTPTGEIDPGIGGSDKPMRHIDYGLGCIESDALMDWASTQRLDPAQPFDLASFYRAMLERDELAAFEVRDRFYEIGSLAGMAETDAFLGRLGRAGVRE